MRPTRESTMTMNTPAIYRPWGGPSIRSFIYLFDLF